MTKTRQATLRTLATIVVVCIVTCPTARAQQSQLVYDGFTQPKYDILVAANEIGRVEDVYVKEGDRVRQGDVIAKLEDSLQAASVRISQQQCSMLGEIEAAKAEVAMHTARTRSLRELADEQMVPPTELARAEADLQIAQARHQTALESTILHRLELDRNRVQLERRKVTSPLSGIVATVFHHPGEYVTPSDPALIRLLVTDQLYAVFNVPVTDLSRIQIGAPVRIILRGSQTNVNSQVFSIAPSIDGESGTVKVRAMLPNEDNKLLAGDRCTVYVDGKSLGNSRSARMPANAVTQTPGVNTK